MLQVAARQENHHRRRRDYMFREPSSAPSSIPHRPSQNLLRPERRRPIAPVSIVIKMAQIIAGSAGQV